MKNILVLCMIFIPIIIQAQAGRKGSMKKPFIFSQQFKHSAGIGVAFYNVNDSYEPVYAIAYNPSVSLTNSWSDFSISVGTQLTGGYHFSSENEEKDFIYADLPLLIEMNMGHNASKDFYSDLGWFIGGGYAYHLVKDEWESGPVATIGGRGFVFGPSISLRYSRYFAISDSDKSFHTITLLLNFGRYFDQVKLNNKVSRFSNGFRK